MAWGAQSQNDYVPLPWHLISLKPSQVSPITPVQMRKRKAQVVGFVHFLGRSRQAAEHLLCPHRTSTLTYPSPPVPTCAGATLPSWWSLHQRASEDTGLFPNGPKMSVRSCRAYAAHYPCCTQALMCPGGNNWVLVFFACHNLQYEQGVSPAGSH